jgi:hypothetical protein
MSTAQRIASTTLANSTSARSLDDTPAMLCDLGVNEFASARLERRDRAFLVTAHQAAVAGHIGCKNSGQSPFDTSFVHPNCLAQRGSE